MESRDYHGYMQLREEGNPKAPWQFVVSSFDGTFTGQDGYCNVQLSAGGVERVRIDARDRILVRRRWYTRTNWMH